MTKILVLAGGNSSEREVSLRSGLAVSRALEEAGYDVLQADPRMEGFDLAALAAGCDLVFPVLHGAGGEDGTIQSALEDLGCAYIGADSAASRICYDKWQYKQALTASGVRNAAGALVDTETFRRSELIQGPFVLKPNDGGSSVDTFIVRNPESADMPVIEEALSRYGTMLLESLIDGREITVGVLQDEALPVVEIVPPSDGEFDYENKYNGRSLELCPPREVSPEVQKQAQQIALDIHRAFHIDGLSRTDMIITFDTQELYVLETNTMPGMTDQSLFPKAAAVAGFAMPDLVRVLVEDVLERTEAATAQTGTA